MTAIYRHRDARPDEMVEYYSCNKIQLLCVQLQYQILLYEVLCLQYAVGFALLFRVTLLPLGSVRRLRGCKSLPQHVGSFIRHAVARCLAAVVPVIFYAAGTPFLGALQLLRSTAFFLPNVQKISDSRGLRPLFRRMHSADFNCFLSRER